MTGSGGVDPAEHHLGDRLAALVDGELGHDTRERVLAHLATCGRCKAEAEAQRRLKSVFAETAPPPPSEGFLARLQGLPGGLPGDRPEGPEGPSREGGPASGALDMRPGRATFAYHPVREPGRSGLGGSRSGFRIHDVGRHDVGRPAADGSTGAQRSRRLAFAVTGAVSLAAFALGGALPLEAAVEGVKPRTDGTGPAATALRAHGATGAESVPGTGLLSAGAGDDQGAVGSAGELWPALGATVPPALMTTADHRFAASRRTAAPPAADASLSPFLHRAAAVGQYLPQLGSPGNWESYPNPTEMAPPSAPLPPADPGEATSPRVEAGSGGGPDPVR
ncbi:anti-sigma factor family protein [Streptomyces sp. TP-A0874]|uniref:anti-sigma factor family protein n=1 Tax=Streptomyces sp. TP-A0874 TaxID=549819 RepID=UPI0008530A25|nr:zf-HC2 domain-containing protein [Streptomyces sp. TP-A0874]